MRQAVGHRRRSDGEMLHRVFFEQFLVALDGIGTVPASSVHINGEAHIDFQTPRCVTDCSCPGSHNY
jgi:hypothetical protein